MPRDRARDRGGRPARLPCAGQRGGGHPIVPEVVAQARALVEGTRLSFDAIAARTGVSRTTLCRWCKRNRWQRPAAPGSGRGRPWRALRGRGRPYGTDAVSKARDLLTGTLLSQKAIAAQIGVCQAQISVWLRRRGWVRPSVRPGSRRFAAASRQGVVAVEGDRRGRPYAPALRAEARLLWEGSRLATALIGARLGVHAATVSRWAKTEGWRRPPGRTGAAQLRGYFGLQRRGRPGGAGRAPSIRRLW